MMVLSDFSDGPTDLSTGVYLHDPFYPVNPVLAVLNLSDRVTV